MNKIGEKIRAARKARGLTQSELGKKLNVSPVAISRAERDLYNPSYKLLLRTASALDMSVAELVGNVHEVTRDGLSSYEKGIISLTQTLNIRGKEKAMAYIEDLAMLGKYMEKGNPAKGVIPLHMT